MALKKYSHKATVKGGLHNGGPPLGAHAISRAHTHVRASQERLRYQINPRCKKCKHDCKQNAAVTVVGCRLYEAKEAK